MGNHAPDKRQRTNERHLTWLPFKSTRIPADKYNKTREAKAKVSFYHTNTIFTALNDINGFPKS
ncbi:unknown [Prevotella sp. CAG:1124]|nr:unknown [Prevotella sp. CAG:1124]